MTRILLRRGTAAQWVIANPTLADGELGLETDSGLIKVGDGAQTWVALPYQTVDATALTGLVPISSGGTNASDGQAALNNLSGADAAAVGQVLQLDGSKDAKWADPLSTIPDGVHGDITTSASGTVWTVTETELAALAALVSAADKVPYFTGSGAAALATFNSSARALAALVGAADRVPYFTGVGAAALATLTAFGRQVISHSTAEALAATLTMSELYSYFWEDFFPAGAASCRFSQSTSGAGANINQAWWAIDTNSNMDGAIYVAAGTSGTGYCSLHTWNNVFIVNRGTRYLLRVRLMVETLASASDDYTFEVGFANNLEGGAGADRIVFRYKRSVSTNWYAVTRKDGTETTTDTGVAVAAGTSNCVILQIDVAADGSTADFDIDDSGGYASHTTNIPTNTVGDRMGMGMYIQQHAYSAVDPRVAADWWHLQLFRTAAR